MIGTGGGGPGLAAYLPQFNGDLPFEVAILDRGPKQAAGLSQLSPRHIYVASSTVINGIPATVLADGATIDLGVNHAGQPLTLEEDQAAHSTWLARMTARFDLVYLASTRAGTAHPKNWRHCWPPKQSDDILAT